MEGYTCRPMGKSALHSFMLVDTGTGSKFTLMDNNGQPSQGAGTSNSNPLVNNMVYGRLPLPRSNSIITPCPFLVTHFIHVFKTFLVYISAGLPLHQNPHTTELNALAS